MHTDTCAPSRHTKQRIRTCIYTYTHMYRYESLLLCAYTCTWISLLIGKSRHTHTHTHTHTHMHMCTRMRISIHVHARKKCEHSRAAKCANPTSELSLFFLCRGQHVEFDTGHVRGCKSVLPPVPFDIDSVCELDFCWFYCVHWLRAWCFFILSSL